ncbi:hypothetical protein HHL17_12720 [Chitinophaga sp. G-6-1-13]|uniref:Uncharacterized protein n=1 Tax=Chitinophaga fulva TaxID=2728842 RepID=A0A848GN08_9BACT|nr:hypothetical protein [Chitinophaga fulva]NML38060.1 hypothetical protein [Chitinophaga fulva]
MLQHYDAGDYINTCEAYSRKAWMGNGYVIIPYINLNLMEGNTVNGINCVINYSYYVLEKVQHIIPEEHPSFDTGMANQDQIDEHIVLGHQQVLIVCRKLSLYLPDNAAFSHWSNPFMPKDTPHFQRNLPEDTVEAFFNHLPETLKVLAGHDARELSL